MNACIEVFAKIDPRWETDIAGKVIRTFRPSDLSDWCVYGTWFDRPFADGKKSAKRWVVSHVGTMRSLRNVTGLMTFKNAYSLALYLDQNVHGMSQVRDPHDVEKINHFTSVDGLSPEFKKEVRSAIDRWMAPGAAK